MNSMEANHNSFNLYVIYDTVAEEAGPIFQAKNDQVALRMYFDLVENSHVNNKLDYDLHQVGKIENCFDVTAYHKVIWDSKVQYEIQKKDEKFINKTPVKNGCMHDASDFSDNK